MAARLSKQGHEAEEPKLQPDAVDIYLLHSALLLTTIHTSVFRKTTRHSLHRNIA